MAQNYFPETVDVFQNFVSIGEPSTKEGAKSMNFFACSNQNF